jgi:uncharacterized protein
MEPHPESGRNLESVPSVRGGTDRAPPRSRIVAGMPEPELTVIDRPEAQRYEAFLGDVLVGFVEYRLAGTRRLLLHTEVDPAFEGRGIGGALARHVLDEARAEKRRVTVKCPFILAWLARHPEYDEWVTRLPRAAKAG